ncbi:hypothetical protein MNEG_2197 [Monoraphidium neglectum]|uniref:Uncharacterized protein n=1 Tax=Monoraphidium neglectum TaxID=145388 RepID=A0A0D2NMA2_9CHLO|nr:hypothetical protein MNEG_2197 [Monoraphidium neglectum]KIZ05761.1 hypothetical protein MNEG_2197 [Monoraphidium neglectum]|eukprot:XP_013904780.1 hypothetical protein MNEG_2197 [Monoraphidium neglectum]
MLQWNWAAYQSGALQCENSAWDVPEDCGKATRTNNATCDPHASWEQCIPRLAPPGQIATENFVNW